MIIIILTLYTMFLPILSKMKDSFSYFYPLSKLLIRKQNTAHFFCQPYISINNKAEKEYYFFGMLYILKYNIGFMGTHAMELLILYFMSFDIVSLRESLYKNVYAKFAISFSSRS